MHMIHTATGPAAQLAFPVDPGEILLVRRAVPTHAAANTARNRMVTALMLEPCREKSEELNPSCVSESIGGSYPS